MASIKIVLRNKPRKDGSMPLAIDIIKDRKHIWKNVGFTLKPEDWDADKLKVRKSHPNHARLNNMIASKLAELSDKVIEAETKSGDVTVRNIRSVVHKEAGDTFQAQGKIYLDGLKASGKFNRYSADRPRVKRFEEFAKGDISFSDISVGMLKKFKLYLKATRGVSDRTIENHIVVIRSVFSQAIESGAADKKYYPFGKGKIKVKFPDTKKIGLSLEEVSKIEDAKLNKYQDHARNVWLFSFYFAGMRASDVLRTHKNDFQDGRFYYKMGKNNKIDSLKVPDKINSIVAKYPDNEGDLLFPDLNGIDLTDEFNAKRRIKTRIKAVDIQLKTIAQDLEINKSLTMHVARHTFAQIASDKIPVSVLQKLFRHTSLLTTIGYMGHFDNDASDNALDSVINTKPTNT